MGNVASSVISKLNLIGRKSLCDIEIKMENQQSLFDSAFESFDGNEENGKASEGQIHSGILSKANLIVNYIPQSLSQDEVRNMFNAIGPVKNCKLVRDHASGISLGYAFLEYYNPEDAQRAILKLDKCRIQSKTLRVSYSRPSSSDIKNANLYIAGLPPTVDEDKLSILFNPFGQIITHKVLYNPDGSSRGVGFVRFDKRSEAQAAIDAMNGKSLDGATVPLSVKFAIPPAVKNLNQALGVNIAQNPVAAAAMMAAGGGRNQNVRFSPMASGSGNNPQGVVGMMAAAAAAQQSLQTPIQNALSGPLDQTGRSMGPWCVYVYGLQPTASEVTLYQLFAPFGAILSVRLMRDLTKSEQHCKGYGFVNFLNYADAHKAVMQMNNFLYEEKFLQVSFKSSRNQK